MSVLVRIQHIDGTLDPAVPVSGSDLLDEVGTSFAMPDGRWVQVVGHAKDKDGSAGYVIVGETPDQRAYSATGREAYVRGAHELRMGSPQYGTLVVDGLPVEGEGDSVEYGSLVWSQDGRYLEAAVLDHWERGPATSVIVVDSETRQVIARSETRPGFSSPGQFVGRSLCYSKDIGYVAIGDSPDVYLPF